jgi:hypothetical protein
MTVRLHVLEARGIRVALDLDIGQLAVFEVRHQGQVIAPFARVPWADDGDDPARFAPDQPPHLRRMSGDFFCAPFCADDVEGAPFHGWTANSPWTLVDETRHSDGITARFRLGHLVAGAVVDKLWTLRDDHPFLYQEHRFAGGKGRLPVAHHAMVDLRAGGLLEFSPKLWGETPAAEIEKDRSVLRYPASGRDVRAFPGKDGPVDLTRYPIGARHEDFVMLVDDPEQVIGWVTALRPAAGDVAILVKPVAVLPQTMLWFSNGGRDHAPWNGQHVGVLGIEEACALGSEGRHAATVPNRLTSQGIPTALTLAAASTVAVRTALGAWTTDAQASLGMTVSPDHITLADGSRMPFDAAFLG